MSVPSLRRFFSIPLRLRGYGIICVFLTIVPVLSNVAQDVTDTVVIGVLAKRGREITTAQWRPTADYLSEQIPEYRFSIAPLRFDEINDAVATRSVDFILANSAIYVALEVEHQVARIATMKNAHRLGDLEWFGSVVFGRSDDGWNDHTIDAGVLRGRRIAAVDETSLGGWLMAYREFVELGIDPYHDAESVTFYDTHDAVVYAVADGEADIGIVRSDTLERMEIEGRTNITSFYHLRFPEVGVQREVGTFPYATSTRLYPEWPIAAAAHTERRLAELVAARLIEMERDDPAAQAAFVAGWTVPQNYQRVHELLQTTRSPPYETYGEVTLRSIVETYLMWIVVIAVVTTAAVVASILLAQRNRELARMRAHLADRVEEKTAELMASNAQLRRSLSEKQTLLAEVHHRVKNNLQVIVSLMNLQMENICDVRDRRAMRRLQSRITSMSLVHESFEASVNAAEIPMSEYLRSLTIQVMESAGVHPERNVHVEFDLDDIELDLGSAVPFGLIVCEILTNAFAHGLTGHDQLHVAMSLAGRGSSVFFTVEDDGPGFTAPVEECECEHIGLTLVRLLAEQLHGTVHIENMPGDEHGARIALQFPVAPRTFAVEVG